jgi:hypothetical protein
VVTRAISAAFLAERSPKIPHLEPAEPLWKRVPTRDAHGRRLSDFMMIIPGLREKRGAELLGIVNRVEHVLDHYQNAIVFADLNLRLSVLWVTVRPIPRICLDIASAIHFLIPEARLVTQKYPFW